VTGNTAIDALQWMVTQPTPQNVQNLLAVLQPDGTPSRSLILVTAHRRESFGQPIHNICEAIRLLARRPDVHLVYPVHRNPNVWQPVHEQLAETERVTLLPPLDYQSLVHIMRRCRLILTDSGGIQEEAPSLGVPVLVLRDKTERPEAVDAGAARLVGNEPGRIVAEAVRLLDDPDAFAAMAQAINPYGDGRAAHRIADLLGNGQCEEFSAS
jgi:UDP-N-acetylglucosamine 2-epimerase (non-hydrolysing)